MHYYLINILRKANKFFVDDQFNETIIKENKNIVKLLANTILDEFLREIVVLNIISLTKTKEVMVKKSDATNYGNYHSAINNTINILKLVQLLVNDSVFEEQLSQKYKSKISNLFVLKTIKIAIKILLYKY